MATAGTTARGAAATTGAPASGAVHGRKDPLGSFGDFLPWILYWVLVGNVAFRLALLIAVLVSVGLLLVRRATGQPWRTLGIGSVVVFVVLLLLSLVVDDTFLERWLQPLSNLGLLLIVLGGMAVGRPFVLDYSRDSVSPAMAASKGFLWLNQRFSAIWAVAFGIMTVSSFIPPLVEGDATISDGGSTLSIVGYWVVPFAALGLAGLVNVAIVRGLHGPDDPQGDVAGTGLRAEASADRGTGGPRLVVPASTPADQPLPIVVQAADDGPVDLEVELVDAFNRRFVSRATFTPSDGRVDVATDAPTSGSWQEADAGGPIWSAEWDEAAPADLFLPVWGPMKAAVTARSGGSSTTTVVVREGLAAGVTVAEVAEAGLVGRAFTPAGPARRGVVLVGGSEGGVDSMSGDAAFLASHGVPALVVGLFGADGLPSTIDQLPLEPIAAGVRWLAGHAGLDAGAVGLVGISRGSEAVLSAAAHLADLQRCDVVALSPGSVVWEALADDGSGTGRSSWTVGGSGLAFASVDDVAIDRDLFRSAVHHLRHRHAPQLMHLHAAYVGGLRRPEAAAAAIPVERIQGRLVLLAGGADGLWPSEAMGQAILERRRDAGRTDDELAVLPGAGHLLRTPLIPVRPFQTGGIDLGGEAAGHAAGQAEVGRRLLQTFAG